jgi:hypothetical protein
LKHIELDVNRHGVAIATAIDRIVQRLTAIESSLKTETRSISDRLDALRFEQYALSGAKEDAPQGLQPGDYCDASKEVADELTAMGWKWYDEDRNKWRVTGLYHGSMLNTDSLGSVKGNKLDAQTFLSRARVTAKELGLKPVDVAAEEAKRKEAERKEAERAEKLAALKWLTPVMAQDGEGAILSVGVHGASVAIKEGGDVLWYHIDDITILP